MSDGPPVDPRYLAALDEAAREKKQRNSELVMESRKSGKKARAKAKGRARPRADVAEGEVLRFPCERTRPAPLYASRLHNADVLELPGKGKQ